MPAIANIINFSKENRRVNPQKENGYTAIANELVDEFCKVKLTGGQFRILLVILRQTYGYHRKADKISASFISKKTGLKIRSVRRDIKELKQRKIIINTPDETVLKSAGHKLAITYRINKDYLSWCDKKAVTQLSPPKKELEKTEEKTDITYRNNKENHIECDKKAVTQLSPLTSDLVVTPTSDPVVTPLYNTKENNKYIPATQKNMPAKNEKTFSTKITDFVGRFIDYISKEFPTRSPKKTESLFQKSADVIDKLNRLDGFELDYIFSVIRWAVKDDFWSAQILSLSALRKKSKNDLSKFQNIVGAFEKRDRKLNAKPLKVEVVKLSGVVPGEECNGSI